MCVCFSPVILVTSFFKDRIFCSNRVCSFSASSCLHFQFQMSNNIRHSVSSSYQSQFKIRVPNDTFHQPSVVFYCQGRLFSFSMFPEVLCCHNQGWDSFKNLLSDECIHVSIARNYSLLRSVQHRQQSLESDSVNQPLLQGNPRN